jgi:polysaccharide export outer membrane protein
MNALHGSNAMQKLILLALAFFVAAGCDQLDMRLRPDMDETEITDLRPQSPPELRPERLAQALATWSPEPAPAEADYLIGPGDTVEVSILSLEQPGELCTLAYVVSRDGNVTLPWVGPVPIGGITVRQAEERVAALYAGRYIKEPQVALRVADYHSVAVVVTGAVQEPGVYYLDKNQSTVLEMLARAGGLSEKAGDELVVCRALEGVPPDSDDTTPAGQLGETTAKVTINLKELIDKGNLLVNLHVADGYVLTVPPRVEEMVYVIGHVRNPGAYELTEGRDVDALRAIAFGGGMLETARPANCFVVREMVEGQKVISVDLSKSGARRAPFLLQSGDTLVVGSSAVARFGAAFSRLLNASVSASATN